MSYALNGVNQSASLANLAKFYGVGVKGDEVVNARGLRRKDFSPQQLAAYGVYCDGDVDLTYAVFYMMMQTFPPLELKLIDATLRMFTEPVLELDREALEEHLIEVSEAKAQLVSGAGVEKSDLMSNPKFAELLGALGVIAPTKISAATGKEAYAFAKTDKGFIALQEHEDPRVQSLVAARLGNKSTLEETRTQRFLGIEERGLLPAPVKYYAAHTGRWGGDDKINLQNLPSRGTNGKKLKKAIVAPEGYVLIDGDSSQIEARVLAWLAGQRDLLESFFRKEDVYKKMAGLIYGISEDEVSDPQRFIGKTTILGCGYQMGGARFQDQLRVYGVDVTLAEATRIIAIYRKANPQITKLWYAAHDMLEYMSRGDKLLFGRKGVLDVVPEENGIRLPSTLLMRYEGLTAEKTDRGYDYSYKSRRKTTYIYGGKVVENVCQGVARCIIGEQLLNIAKKYKIEEKTMRKVHLFITNIIDDGAGFGCLPDGAAVFIPKGVGSRANVVAGETYHAAIVPNKHEDVRDRTPWFAVFVGEKVPEVTTTYENFDGGQSSSPGDLHKEDTAKGYTLEETVSGWDGRGDQLELAIEEEEVIDEMTVAEETRELILNGDVWTLGALLRTMFGSVATYATHKEDYSEMASEVTKIHNEGLLHKAQVTTAGATKSGFDFFSVNRAALMPPVVQTGVSE
jgi:DNA polymerase